MHNYLEDKNLYNSTQHGFRPGRSCLSQLLAHVERLTFNLQNDENVDAIYLDFSKAFDKVDHAILLQKLQNIGIRGQLLNWLKSFLTEILFCPMNQQLSVEYPKAQSWVCLLYTSPSPRDRG